MLWPGERINYLFCWVGQWLGNMSCSLKPLTCSSCSAGTCTGIGWQKPRMSTLLPAEQPEESDLAMKSIQIDCTCLYCSFLQTKLPLGALQKQEPRAWILQVSTGARKILREKKEKKRESGHEEEWKTERKTLWLLFGSLGQSSQNVINLCKYDSSPWQLQSTV